MISHVRLVWKLIIMTQSVCQHVTVCMVQTVLPVPDLNSHCRCSCMCSVQWANFTIISWAHLFHLQIFRYPDIVTAVMDCSPTWLAWMTSYSAPAHGLLKGTDLSLWSNYPATLLYLAATCVHSQLCCCSFTNCSPHIVMHSVPFRYSPTCQSDRGQHDIYTMWLQLKVLQWWPLLWNV